MAGLWAGLHFLGLYVVAALLLSWKQHFWKNALRLHRYYGHSRDPSTRPYSPFGSLVLGPTARRGGQDDRLLERGGGTIKIVP